MSLTELVALALFIGFTYFFLLVFIQDALNKVRFEIEEIRKAIEKFKTESEKEDLN
jgi:F0F1-type ATP synthase membrane subunit b/b'